MLLAGELSSGQTVHIASREGRLSFDVTGTADRGD
jgi:hypothetical protein